MSESLNAVNAPGMPVALRQALGWVVTLLVPVTLVLGVVRLLFSPPFISVEYNAPGFPADTYGFTKEERMQWARVALDYLHNDRGIEFLGDLQFEDGTPLYNERELRHMLDVKIVFQGALKVWYVTLIGLLALGVWAWRSGWLDNYRLGLARGGWLTVILLGTIILFVLLSFGPLFVFFHRIFFTGDTWLFQYTDTLIRLFPERLWRDLFIAIGGLSALIGLILALSIRPKG